MIASLSFTGLIWNSANGPFNRTKRSNDDYLNLELTGSLRRQIATRVIFPLSGPQTRKVKMEVCYIHASRIFDVQVAQGFPTHRVIENLCYALNDLSRTKQQCIQGSTVIVNMKHFQVFVGPLDATQYSTGNDCDAIVCFVLQKSTQFSYLLNLLMFLSMIDESRMVISKN